MRFEKAFIAFSIVVEIILFLILCGILYEVVIVPSHNKVLEQCECKDSMNNS